MATTHESESDLRKSGTRAATIDETEGIGRGRTSQRRGSRPLIASTASTFAVILIFTLPASIAFSNKNYIYAKIPFLKQLGFRLPSSRSAVLAVDVNDLTIQSRSASADTIEHFEKAAMAQLVNLHRTYSGWVENHEDLSGSLMVKLRVDKSGDVVHVDPLAVRLSNAAFAQVVLSEIRRWNFPPDAAAPVEITMPLLFVPKGMDSSTVVHWERKTRVAEEETIPARAAQPATTAVTASAPPSPSVGAPTSGNARYDGIKPAKVVQVSQPTPAKQILPAYKTNRAVGLRSHPRYSAERVHEIDADTELNLLENQGDWLKVRVANAESMGFVRKEFLTPIQ